MFRPLDMNDGSWHKHIGFIFNPPRFSDYIDAGNDTGDYVDVYPPDMSVTAATENTLVAEFHSGFDAYMERLLDTTPEYEGWLSMHHDPMAARLCTTTKDVEVLIASFVFELSDPHECDLALINFRSSTLRLFDGISPAPRED